MTQNSMPKVMKETRNKIRVEFDRTPLKERLMAKFVSLFFLKKVVWFIFRLILLIGISYVILFPFITKIAGSFMPPDDFVDVTVRLIPRSPNLDIYKAIWEENAYLEAFGNTLLLSGSSALIQTFVCCLIGYGLAKFKFKGNKWVFAAVIFTMVVPHQTLQLSMFMNFRYFDILGIFQFLNGGGISLFGLDINNALFSAIDIFPEAEEGFWTRFTASGIKLTDSYMPLIVLSLGGLAFKNGLYIFMLRQFYQGVPDELEESAYMDGSGTFRTFLQIILPLSIPMMITVFLFAFCWQWTDDFYTNFFFPTGETILMPDVVEIPDSLRLEGHAAWNFYSSAIRNTCGLMIIAPLVVLYCFGQKFLIQGIESSGLAN